MIHHTGDSSRFNLVGWVKTQQRRTVVELLDLDPAYETRPPDKTQATVDHDPPLRLFALIAVPQIDGPLARGADGEDDHLVAANREQRTVTPLRVDAEEKMAKLFGKISIFISRPA